MKAAFDAMVKGAYNCLMYAMGDIDGSKGTLEAFQKEFNRSSNGAKAFEAMCHKLRIPFRRVKNFASANIAVASFIYQEMERDYEGILHCVSEYPTN